MLSLGKRIQLWWLVLALLMSGTIVKAQVFQWAVVVLQPYFVIRSIGGKCLDFGPAPQLSGAPVFIYECNGTAAQQIRIEEINTNHDVVLHAGNKVIGIRGAPPVRTAGSGVLAGAILLDAESPLELQDQTNSAMQVFALDGDSILLAGNREVVVKVQNGAGRNRTPLVLGRRELADAEFWTFSDTLGTGARPTTGFVRISQINDFDGGLQAARNFISAVQAARWGTVIEIDPGVVMYLTDIAPLHVPAGVTIRGDRRGTRAAPLLSSAYNIKNQPVSEFHLSDSAVLEIVGNYVRITGLRMVGPSRGIEEGLPYATAITTQDQFVSIIDHNELSDWTASAVFVGNENPWSFTDPYSRPQNVRVVRNFIHHNNKWGNGYGVVTNGGYPYIEGNTFISNRHAIAASNQPASAYRAWFNLVLSAYPDYSSLGWKPTPDFDAHGTGNDGCEYCGGDAGEYFEIARNTFLGTNRFNFELRGTPKGMPAYSSSFHDNVSLRVSALGVPNPTSNMGSPAGLIITNNQFPSANPTSRLGVGDFDGDGIQDLFLATGAAWYYAPAGRMEWRYLNAQKDAIGTLLFGDFDADGRTDVFTQHGSNWDVSWGGASRWETINGSGPALASFAVGNFVGDRRDDIFYADGSSWYASDASVSMWGPLDVATSRVADLRFGDFDGDGKTDVFGVKNGDWVMASSGTSGWQRLRAKLSDSVAGLIVADFNGDGRADVATPALVSSTSWALRVSYSGLGNWTQLRAYPLQSAVAGIGSFDQSPGADVLLWSGNRLQISSQGAGIPAAYSRDDMR